MKRPGSGSGQGVVPVQTTRHQSPSSVSLATTPASAADVQSPTSAPAVASLSTWTYQWIHAGHSLTHTSSHSTPHRYV